MDRLSRYLRAGFSLIEVNMAIFVLAGGALALLALFPLGLNESTEANSEMRVAAFADRFIGAAKIAAEQAANEDEFEDLLGEALDISEGSFSLRDDSDEENDSNDYDEVLPLPRAHRSSGCRSGCHQVPPLTGCFPLRRRAGPEQAVPGRGHGHHRLGLLVTAENPKQNPRAMRYADGYGVKVVIDPRGKQ